MLGLGLVLRVIRPNCLSNSGITLKEIYERNKKENKDFNESR